VRHGTGAWLLTALGAVIHIDTGRFEEAVTACRQALVLQREVGDRWGEAWTLAGLGKAWHDMAKPAEARECLAPRTDHPGGTRSAGRGGGPLPAAVPVSPDLASVALQVDEAFAVTAIDSCHEIIDSFRSSEG
jgi:hypothetical protein